MLFLFALFLIGKGSRSLITRVQEGVAHFSFSHLNLAPVINYMDMDRC